MSYRYETGRADFSDLAGGFVLKAVPGFPGFPVRLASEVFQRAAQLCGAAERVTLWDPCCGSGYLLSTIGLLHRQRLAAVFGTDADPDALGVAASNLRMLSRDGLLERRRELAGMAERHGKNSHQAAVDAADRLIAGLPSEPGPRTGTAVANAFDPEQTAAALGGRAPDIVCTDVPYGDQVGWSGAPDDPIPALIRSIAEVVPPSAVIAVTCRARKVPLGDGIRAAERLKVGHRSVALVPASRIER
ncbi:rRNA methyltransferase [Saccharopolyspora sp. HNM0986]|nr:rRNA methyltransferase [Saccharopolyspora sp. HNM0986]